MEPIRHTKSARFYRLKLYREQLDQLLTLFKNNCETVTVSDNANKYVSFDEMKEHLGARIKELDIHSTSPGVHFLVNKTEMTSSVPQTTIIFHELRTEETTDAADTLFYKIREFLNLH